MQFLNLIWDFVLSIDIREILYAAVGAFVGFGLAIILEKKSTQKKDAEIVSVSLKNLLMELHDISSEIEKADQTVQMIIDIPIYEASVKSGNILAFVDKSYYIDLLKTYSSIKYLAKIEENNSANSNQEIMRTRKKVQCDIQSIVKLIECDNRQKRNPKHHSKIK